jgi:hypothetical protein
VNIPAIDTVLFLRPTENATVFLLPADIFHVAKVAAG